MREDHYNKKSLKYGISGTRLKKIENIIDPKVHKRALDIGCATGYLGARLKQMGIEYVAGIDISSEVIQKAGAILDRTFVFDIEREWPETIRNERYDLVVMAEVIEHVFDPKEVLTHIRSHLSDKGQIIITTPNFLCWTNRIKMLFGDFRYKNDGPLDFGHIRFFTHSYLKEVLRETGFSIVVENNIIFPGKLTKLLKFWPSLFAFQFIIKAQKSS